MKQDRFLIGILIFIGLLVVAAVALFFVRNQAPAYGPEDTPQGVLYNYAVALQLRDYTRAYGYLADKPNKPTLDAFRQAFLTHMLDTSTTALQVGDTQSVETDEVWINVSVEYAGNGVLDSRYSNTDRATLVKQNGAWKITYLPNPYWWYDWYQPTPVK
jgi:hypothetical protein